MRIQNELGTRKTQVESDKTLTAILNKNTNNKLEMP